MEDQCSPLCWPYYYQVEGMEELKHSLLYTTLELETTIASAQEEIASKDDELVHLKSLVNKITKEKDEVLAKCQTLMLEKLLLGKQLQQQQEQQQLIIQQQQHLIFDAAPSSGTTSIEDEPRKGESNVVHSSSDCDESFIASPGKDLLVDVTEKLVLKKPLPEKGKFLQAVMEAGPLLQTLLLAGPLPQWQHPPPQLNTIDIPPVAINSSQTPRLLHHQDSRLSSTNGYFSKKRVLEGSDQLGFDSSPPNSKYQRVVHQSALTNI